jgi:hypothetical protein
MAAHPWLRGADHRFSRPWRILAFGQSFGLFESQDAHAALAWLRREHPGSRIGVIGFSLGGAASLLGPQGPLDVDAMVLEGVYPDIRHAIFNRLASRLGRFPATLIEPLLSWQSLPRFGVRPSAIAPIRVLGHVHVPVMVVGGGSDINTPPEETSAMAAATGVCGTSTFCPASPMTIWDEPCPKCFNAACWLFWMALSCVMDMTIRQKGQHLISHTAVVDHEDVGHRQGAPEGHPRIGSSSRRVAA